MYEVAQFIFWITLILYGLTLFFISYVGVYLTYIAIPVIVLSGLIMKFTKPSEKQKSKISTALSETGKATTFILQDLTDTLDGFNDSMGKWNRKQSLFLERSRPYRDKISKLRIARVEPEIHLKYAKSLEERLNYQATIKSINDSIKELESKI